MIKIFGIKFVYVWKLQNELNQWGTLVTLVIVISLNSSHYISYTKQKSKD